MSYLENALTSNPVLGKLAARSQKDVYGVIKMAERVRRGDQPAIAAEGIEFEGNYALEELNEFVSTMVKLMRVRDVVLTVNREYIQSAAQHDDYRTEPPFLLQGSYRNMNRIAERVLPVMNDAELETLIESSYQNDAQTLTTGTEANLLKFKELLGKLSEKEQGRWDDIRRTFRQNVKLRGVGSDDKVGQVIATLSTFSDGLDSIRKAVTEGVTRISETNGKDEIDPTDEHIATAIAKMEGLGAGLAALSERLNDGLMQIARLADRPLNIEVPPIDVKWPETPLVAAPPPTEHVPAAPTVVDDEGSSAEMVRPDRITIVNRLPRTMMNVLEQQFELMQGWMRPLLEMSTAQKEEFAELRPMVEDCLKHYRVLLRKLEDAHDRGEGE